MKCPKCGSENLEIISAYYHLPKANLLLINQGVSGHAEFAEEASQYQITADGIVTATPDIILGIGTADCAPVLFFDEVDGVIGAAHAGCSEGFFPIIDGNGVFAPSARAVFRKDKFDIVCVRASKRDGRVKKARRNHGLRCFRA